MTLFLTLYNWTWLGLMLLAHSTRVNLSFQVNVVYRTIELFVNLSDLLGLFFSFHFTVCKFFLLSDSENKIITWSYLSFGYCTSLFGQLLSFYFFPFLTPCIWHLFENCNKKIKKKKKTKSYHEILTSVFKYWVQFDTLSKQPIPQLLEFATCSLRLRRWIKCIKNKSYHNVYFARRVGLAFGSVVQGQEPRMTKADLLRYLHLEIRFRNGRGQPKKWVPGEKELLALGLRMGIEFRPGHGIGLNTGLWKSFESNHDIYFTAKLELYASLYIDWLMHYCITFIVV